MAESSTPKKFFRIIKYTPTTKKILCLICGNRIEKSDYRRKLFHGSSKTEYCFLIEKYLDINVTEETHTDTACRKCVRELQKVDNTVTTFKQSYQCTLGKLRETHGCDSISFKRQFAEEGTSASRKVLFADDRDENVPDIEGNNSVKVRFCKHSKIIILLLFHSLFFFSLCLFEF